MTDDENCKLILDAILAKHEPNIIKALGEINFMKLAYNDGELDIIVEPIIPIGVESKNNFYWDKDGKIKRTATANGFKFQREKL